MIRRVTSVAIRSRPAGACLAALEARLRPVEGEFSVLTYHRIAEPGEDSRLDPALISATPSEFEEQIRFVSKRYAVISLEELLEVRHARQPLPRGALLLTFDDAYRDFASNAWPIVKDRGLPVAMFVPTLYPGRSERGFWWDRLHSAFTSTSRRTSIDTLCGTFSLKSPESRLRAFRAVRTRVRTMPHTGAMETVDDIVRELGGGDCGGAILTWGELRALAADGVTLAPHGRTHAFLTGVPPNLLSTEIEGAIEDLERAVGPVPPVFAYPGGSYDERSVDLAARAGISIAFTTDRGKNRESTADWLRLRRINLGRRGGLAALRAQLLLPTIRKPSVT